MRPRLFCAQNITKLSDDEFQCKLCEELFCHAEAVHKHIELMHWEAVISARLPLQWIFNRDDFPAETQRGSIGVTRRYDPRQKNANDPFAHTDLLLVFLVLDCTLMFTTKAEQRCYFSAAVVKEPDRPVGHRECKELDLPVGHHSEGVNTGSDSLDDTKDHDRPVGHHQCKERDLPVGHLRGSSFFDDGKGPDRLVGGPS